MLNKLLIAGMAGAAFVAIGASTANAQVNGRADCADISTVADITQAGECAVSDKIFSNFEFNDVPDDWSFSITRLTPVTGDLFLVVLGLPANVGGVFDVEFDYSYTIEIDPALGPDNRFQSIGLTLITEAADNNVASSKTYDLFDAVDALVPVGGDVLSVDGTNTSDFDVIGAAPAIKKITVRDEVVAAQDGIFVSLTNSFRQTRVTIETPVPASLALFGFGLVALGYRLRRKA